jgi:hypothetical protein
MLVQCQRVAPWSEYDCVYRILEMACMTVSVTPCNRLLMSAPLPNSALAVTTAELQEKSVRSGHRCLWSLIWCQLRHWQRR